MTARGPSLPWRRRAGTDDRRLLRAGGQRIGKTLSATEFKPFSRFVQGLHQAGYEPEGCNPVGVYRVMLTCEGRKGPGTKYSVPIVSLSEQRINDAA